MIILLLLFLAAPVYGQMWQSPDGRHNFQNPIPPYLPGTAIDLWPPLNEPRWHSLSEITMHSTGWWARVQRRLNISAMAKESYNPLNHTVGYHYRIGVEADGKQGEFHPIIFCYEDYYGIGLCPFGVFPDGEYMDTGLRVMMQDGNWPPAVRKVVIGAADSCGEGYRCLRIGN